MVLPIHMASLSRTLLLLHFSIFRVWFFILRVSLCLLHLLLLLLPWRKCQWVSSSLQHAWEPLLPLQFLTAFTPEWFSAWLVWLFYLKKIFKWIYVYIWSMEECVHAYTRTHTHVHTNKYIMTYHFTEACASPKNQVQQHPGDLDTSPALLTSTCCDLPPILLPLPAEASVSLGIGGHHIWGPVDWQAQQTQVSRVMSDSSSHTCLVIPVMGIQWFDFQALKSIFTLSLCLFHALPICFPEE